MDFTKTVTPEEKEYIQRIFNEFQLRLEEKIQKDVHNEMLLLSKYKGDLARSYHEVAGHKSVLAGLMKDLLNNQEALFFMIRDLVKVISGKYPEAKDRIDAVEEEQPWK